MPSVEVAGRELFCVRRGEGAPLLLVPGMTGDHRHWGEPFLRALERRFDLILYDHRGTGRSGPCVDPFTIADLADDAAGILAALEVEDAHVLGISMGGMVAQELALNDPRRVRTLALGCTYAGGPSGRLGQEGVARQLVQALTPESGGGSSPRGAVEESFHAFLAGGSEFPLPMAVLRQQYEAVARHDTRERLGRITAPTLVLHGDRDRLLDAENAHLLAARIPGARLEILPGGHHFFLEHPRRTAELLVEHAGAAR